MRQLANLVRERAKYLCEYCHSSEEASAAQFSIDHILPQSLGGSDEPDNLALACQRCNGYSSVCDRFWLTLTSDRSLLSIISVGSIFAYFCERCLTSSTVKLSASATCSILNPIANKRGIESRWACSAL